VNDLSPFARRTAPARSGQVPRSAGDRQGRARAHVELARRLDTLWINTGTLCNLACKTCYIESSPRNDALVYIRPGRGRGYLDEAQRSARARSASPAASRS
jgi:hypothetical protein